MKPVILILDDDLPTLELYTRELAAEFSIFPCDSVDEAQQILEAQKFSAIVFEPAMAGGRGWDFLSWLHQERNEQKTPVIICSTQDERRDLHGAETLAFLVKPVLPDQLAQTLNTVLRRRTM